MDMVDLTCSNALHIKTGVLKKYGLGYSEAANKVIFSGWNDYFENKGSPSCEPTLCSIQDSCCPPGKKCVYLETTVPKYSFEMIKGIKVKPGNQAEVMVGSEYSSPN